MTPPPKLDPVAVRERLATVPAWTVDDRRLHRSFCFADFASAFAFMTRVAFLAERHHHHPDWSNVYSRVDIDLWTHDAGGLTEKDFALAAAIDAVV